MKTLFLLAVGTALGMGTASMLHADHHGHFAGSSAAIEQNDHGAFRDGLFLGRIAAEAGAMPYIAVGRWSTAEDRASFTAGYQEGYKKAFASRPRS
jgi:hypothetical protein